MPDAAVPDAAVPDAALAASDGAGHDVRLGRRAALVDRLRARIRGGAVPPFDGMVWLAHLDAAGAPRLFSRVVDPVADLDELYLLDLLSTLEAIGLPGVTVAIWRDSGEATAVDRRLARDLADRLGADGGTVLDAVLVLNQAGGRTVRPSRSSRSSRSSGSGRPSRSGRRGSRSSGEPP